MAFYRLKNFTEELMLRLGLSSLSELEDHLLRHRGELYAEVMKRSELERQLAAAEERLSLATKLQRQKVAEQTAELDRSIKSLDC